MTGWEALGVIAVCGLVGALGKALIGGVGVPLPRRMTTPDGPVWAPGFIGILFAGPRATALSWALYGPIADALAIGSEDGAERIEYTLSWSELGGAVLVGYAGARWISAEADKALNKATATTAARAPADPELAETIKEATPEEALDVALERTK